MLMCIKKHMSKSSNNDDLQTCALKAIILNTHKLYHTTRKKSNDIYIQPTCALARFAGTGDFLQETAK